jgi:hypothetical protein
MNIEFNTNPVFGKEKMYSQVLQFRHRGNWVWHSSWELVSCQIAANQQLLRWHIMRWERLCIPASKYLQSFKLLIWKIVWNLLATTEIVLAHVSAINWDQLSQKQVKLPDTEQHCKRETWMKLTAQLVNPWCSCCRPDFQRVPSSAIYY